MINPLYAWLYDNSYGSIAFSSSSSSSIVIAVASTVVSSTVGSPTVGSPTVGSPTVGSSTSSSNVSRLSLFHHLPTFASTVILTTQQPSMSSWSNVCTCT